MSWDGDGSFGWGGNNQVGGGKGAIEASEGQGHYWRQCQLPIDIGRELEVGGRGSPCCHGSWGAKSGGDWCKWRERRPEVHWDQRSPLIGQRRADHEWGRHGLEVEGGLEGRG